MVKGSILFFTLLLFTVPFAADASSPFFEFNPDFYNTRPLVIIYSETPSEIFIPQNDFINGFDLWIDNDGPSGTATFEFIADDSVLVTKNVAIPQISKISGGQRFHVDIGQTPVSNDRKYSIRITSLLPFLQIYYSNRVKYLAHNASYISEYINGAAKLGNEEKEFSFKFALYEGSETKIPIVSNVSTSIMSEDLVKLSFNADEPVDYKIEYGKKGTGFTQQTSFTGDYKFCGEGLTNCELPALVEPNNIYDYRLSVKDSWGNIAQVTGSFPSMATSVVTPIISPSSSQEPTSTPPVDAAPPLISGVQIALITPNSIDIAWHTDEAADSAFLISYTVYFLSIAAGNDTTFEMEHLMKTGPVLNPSTTYFATITSRDISNNPASYGFSFTTPGAGPDYTPPPTSTPVLSPSPTNPIISGQPTPAPQTPTPSVPQIPQNDDLPDLILESGSGNSVIIKWSPPSSGEPTNDYRIDVFSPDGKKIGSKIVPAGTHQTSLDGSLTGNNTAIVYADNGGIFEKVAKPAKILRPQKSFLERLLILLPYLLGGLVVISFGIVLAIKYLNKGGKKFPPPSTGNVSNSVSSSSRPFGF